MINDIINDTKRLTISSKQSVAFDFISLNSFQSSKFIDGRIIADKMIIHIAGIIIADEFNNNITVIDIAIRNNPFIE